MIDGLRAPEIPLRHLARFVPGSTPSQAKAQYWDDGRIPWVTPKDMTSDYVGEAADHVTELARTEGAVQVLPTGSVLMLSRGLNHSRPLPVAVATRPLAVSRDIWAFVCGPRLRPDFLAAFLSSQADSLLAWLLWSPRGAGSMPVEALRNLRIPCLPLSAQDEIVSRLRQRVGDIDSLVAAKRAALPYLAEKRRSVICESVARGIDGNSPMRPSGIPWVGDIPAHWDVRKTGHLGRIRIGATPPRDEAGYWASGTVPWVTSAVASQWEVTSSGEFVTQDAIRDCRLPALEEGAVLVATAGSGPIRGQATILSTKATINQNLIAIEPEPHLADPWYLRWLLYAAYNHLRDISDHSGHVIPRLKTADIADLRVPVPPIEEQRSISHYISREAAALDKIASVTEHTIELLEELRITTISTIITK